MSSILETFFILFQTDAKRVQAEIESADDAAEGLAQTLDSVGTVDTSGVEALGAAIDGAGESAQATAGAVEDVDKAAQDAGKSAGEIGDEVRKAKAPAEAVTREFNLADHAAEKVSGSVAEWGSRLGGALATLLSIGAAVNAVRMSFDNVNRLTEEADRLGFGQNVEGLNAANQVLEDYGGNADKAQRNLRRFADSVAAAYGDAESAAGKAFKSLGVNAADAEGNLKDTEQVMLDLAGALEKVSKREQINKLRELGLVDPSLRELLTGGRANMASRFAGERSKGLITNEQARNVREFKMAWDDAKDAVTGFFNALVGNWAPALVKFSNRLEAMAMWLREHKTLVQGFAIGISVALAGVAAVLWGSYIPAWVAAAVATLAATWPIVAITAAVLAAAAAFALLWEDVQAFLRGQPSLLGELLAKYEWLGKGVRMIGDAWEWLSSVGGAALKSLADVASWAFGQLWRVGGPVLGLLGDLLGFMFRTAGTTLKALGFVGVETFKLLWAAAQPALQLVGAMVEWVGGIFGKVAKGIWGVWGGMFDRFVARFTTVVDWLRKMLGLAEQARQKLDAVIPGGKPPKETVRAVQAGQAQVAQTRNTPLAAQTSNTVTSKATTRQTNVKVEKVEVHTQATDAQGIAKATGGALTSELRRASAQFDDGVER